MYAVYIVDGHSEPIAMFEFVEHAEDWARDNYFGQWLLQEVTIPLIHPMSQLTDEQIEEIEKDAEKLAAKFRSLPEAED